MKAATSLFLIFLGLQLALVQNAIAQGLLTLTSEQAASAAADYQQYCALCHGEDRQGHVNDHAPSLRSRSLLEAGVQERFLAMGYGRPGTPMAGFFEEIGGPLNKEQLFHLTLWLQDQAGVEQIVLPLETITGDIEAGKRIYADQCSECHGATGEGVTGTALGNPAMLSVTTDHFIRHAIVNGRQGTKMAAFREKLNSGEIDAVTAFIRSRATGWEVHKPVFRTPPTADEYVLNPNGEPPEFELKDELYVMSKDLNEALEDKRRLVLLDTRSMSMWQMAHIEGSVPLPYYYDDVTRVADDLPRDGTWIVSYCECPRAAAEYVNKQLVGLGFKNTAVLWEGAYGWVGLGYPMSRGETTLADMNLLDPQ